MRMITLILVTALSSVVVNQAQEAPKSLPELVVIRAVAPSFPLPKGSTYAFGSVVVEIQVDAHGSVQKAKAVQGHPSLYETSEKAAQRWRFAASALASEARTARLTFVFKVMEADTLEEDLSSIFMPPFQIEVRRNLFVTYQRVSSMNPPFNKRWERARHSAPSIL